MLSHECSDLWPIFLNLSPHVGLGNTQCVNIRHKASLLQSTADDVVYSFWWWGPCQYNLHKQFLAYYHVHQIAAKEQNCGSKSPYKVWWIVSCSDVHSSTPCPDKKEATLFSTITLVSLGTFHIFLPLETGMNIAQLHVIYLLNSLMTERHTSWKFS